MAKLKPNEKRVQLSFIRPEDVALFERLSAMAYDRRYDLPTFLLLALQEAFADTGSASRPVLQEPQSSTPPGTDTLPDLAHRSSIAASVLEALQTPSDPPE